MKTFQLNIFLQTWLSLLSHYEDYLLPSDKKSREKLNLLLANNPTDEELLDNDIFIHLDYLNTDLSTNPSDVSALYRQKNWVSIEQQVFTAEIENYHLINGHHYFQDSEESLFWYNIYDSKIYGERPLNDFLIMAKENMSVYPNNALPDIEVEIDFTS